MDDFNKSKILANLIIQKGIDVFTASIPKENDKTVKVIVGIEYIKRGEIQRGLNILERVKSNYGQDFLEEVIRIATDKLSHRNNSEAIRILEELQKRNYNIDYEKHFNATELIELARNSVMARDFELFQRICGLVYHMGGQDGLQALNDIAYKLVTDEETFELGMDVIDIIKSYSKENIVRRLKDVILNMLKRGDLDFGLKILSRTAMLTDKVYLPSVVELGYQKIAQGKTEEGVRILKFAKSLGAQVDESVLGFI